MLVTVTLLTTGLRVYGGAGIATDGRVGARSTIAGANAGPGNFLIPQALGSLAGNNLFHSFSTFNIDTSQTARFATTSASIANVISRVTGGSPSQINGMLQLMPAVGSAPAFYFINAAGVAFGAGAAIDVPGAFHVGTADYVKFANGDRFYADPAQGSTLSSAAPAAFGFLGATVGRITVKDGAELSTTQPSQPISIVAGDIEVNKGLVHTEGSDIRVVAIGQAAQQISFSGALPAASGTVDITNGGRIAALDSGAIAVSAGHINIDSRESDAYTGIFALAYADGNAGAVAVNADSVAITGRASEGNPAGIFSQAWYGTGNAGSVDVLATGAVSLLNGGQIAADTFSAGNAGRVKVSAGSIAVDGQGSIGDSLGYGNTGISSKAYKGSAGATGRIEVTATGTLSLINGGQVSADTWASGDAGAVKVHAGSIAIDGKNSRYFTGIFSQANAGTGKAGNVSVTVTEDLSLVAGGQISADTWASGDAGAIVVSAGRITIDRRESNGFTGIFCRAIGSAGSTGHAGSVVVLATGKLSLVNGGVIASDTFSAGDAGTVMVRADSITIDAQNSSNFTGIFSQATQGTGNAGDVDVAATGNLSLVHGGEITSNTFTSGHAGTIKVSAGSITVDAQGGNSFTGIFSQANAGTGNAGRVDVSATGDMSLVNGGEIASNTNSSAHAGTVKVSAGRIVIDNGGEISSGTFSSGDAGTVTVSAGSIAVDRQGSSTPTGIFSQANSGTGNAGRVDVLVTGALSLDHGGVVASNTYSSGHGGTIEVKAGTIAISHGGEISSGTFSSGDAGTVTVSAGSIAVDRQGSSTPTGIFSQANSGTGNAGRVNVLATGAISLDHGGVISSNTYSAGHAGTIDVSTGTIAIDHGGAISSSTAASGHAGMVKVSAGTIAIASQGSGSPTGIFSLAWLGTGNAGSVDVTASSALSIVNGGIISSDTLSSGRSGSVKVDAGRIVLDNGGTISSSTYSSGNAGTVKVNADSIAISDFGSILSAAVDGTGNAGSLDVSTTGNLSIDHGGAISSSTLTSGNAGMVKVSAGNLTIGSLGKVNGGGISSQAERGTGNAGSVDVSATGRLSVEHGGIITSSTLTSGTAGSVTIRAGSLRVDGDSSRISAAATHGSSGQTGFVRVDANDIVLSNGGQISIENNATVADPSVLTPTSIIVTAPDITIVDSPNAISTSSTGNVAAGNIRIVASDQLRLDPSGITTTANQGNGGAIDITAGVLRLQDSQIATSVRGLAGNGGNISILANSLIMNTGFIQANTAATNASGGLVSITANNLTASGGTLFVGGNTPHTFQPGVFGFNVIQAAAPSGVSGAIQISSPQLDITSSLVGLDTGLIDAQLARRLCENSRGSSLVPVGRGGLPPGRADFLSPGQVFGIGSLTSPSVSLPAARANWQTAPLVPCLAVL